VNGTIVWARDERISYQLTYNFYHALEEQTSRSSPQNSVLLKVVDDGLVDYVLVRDKLRSLLSDDEIQEKTNTRMLEILGGSQGLTQVMEFTKVSQKNTQKYFLEPMARRELLEELLVIKQEEDFMEWLSTARDTARVWVWWGRGAWNKSEGYNAHNE
jgi:hypothetical protein